ncbi:MAG: diguanylate cyclase [Desulfuromonas sp.]|nr:diguanylate cyclase [Desulfuromonas sp.]
MSTVLIVEDSRMFGLLVQKNIQRQLSQPTIWVTSFAEAKQIMDERADSLSVALLDLNLPDAESGEVVDYAVSKGIPSIVFTSNFDVTLHQSIWNKGVVDYVLKEGPDSLSYIVAQAKRLEKNPRIKVLVVDDSPLVRDLISQLLEIHRFPVLTAENGTQALEILKQNPDIQLIVTDYNMPDMDGFQLTRTIRRKHSKNDVVIIGLSAQDNHQISAKFLKYGANDFISKPFFAEEFYCRINQNLDTIDHIQQIKESSYRDFLTGLHNRRFFFEQAPKLIKSSQQMGVAILDIDLFKKVNDTYGHDAGDVALKHVASLLKEHIPATQLISRFGGEEFCVLCCNLNNNQIFQQFDILRQVIEQTPVPLSSGPLTITMSIGVCVCPAGEIDAAIATADHQLYAAKQQGRNRVCIDSGDSDSIIF